ncbi:MAG: molybdopterin-binding protein [Candidatus Bathyarchaeota archaeon]|nr:molybdopterin-binding protein [Candidatus Termiticorpusculum sp.]MCL1970263.1 molybdopterin-binding protein [Candidatus Termiticorpusculum sp.]
MFRKLLTLEEAKKIIEENFKPAQIDDEDVALLEAYNRVLKENVISTIDVPAFNRSTVDGYAVKAEDTFNADENQPITLNISGIALTGEQPKNVLAKGEAIEIVTGAPIPEGANAVIMLEDTERVDNQLQIYTAIAPYMNIMKKGSDIKTGETILHTRQTLGAPEIGTLAALGLTKVRCFKPPIIAILSIGNEITETGKTLIPGKIFDINTYSLSTAIIECGAKPIIFGIVPDDKNALRKTLITAISSADAVITSGGVSIGPYDYTPQIVDSLGKPGVVISGIAVKPGKPTTIAFIQNKPIFSLPGNPAAALLMFHILVRPTIFHLCGKAPHETRTIRAFAGAKLFSAKGRRTFITVKLALDIEKERLIAEPITEASGAITTLTKADGFIEIPENQQYINKDEEITVKLFRQT